MDRRTIVKLAMGLPLAGAQAGINANPSTATPLKTSSSQLSNVASDFINSAVFVPGYWPDAANSEGMSALYHPELSRGIPSNYEGPIRMMTRLELDGEVIQALFPVFGHDVKISPKGDVGFYGSLEYDNYVCFDAKTLDVIALGKPFDQDWIGGGHGLFLDEGSSLALTERAPKVGYLGDPSRHFGRITLRDPETLKILDSYSTHGVSPHDVRLMPDKKHLAIANYGSTFPRQKTEYGLPRHIVEPSVTIVDIANGKLVEKYLSGSEKKELRHICALDFDNIFAIQTEMRSSTNDNYFREEDVNAYETDITARKAFSYFPAPTMKKISGSNNFENLGSKKLQRLMRHGLSIDHDPIHNEVIATYPSSHSIIVFDGQTGEIKHHTDCAKMGLDYPCGLVMLPNSPYYAVSGYWKNLYIFHRGTHQLERQLCHYTTFFGHSHIATV